VIATHLRIEPLDPAEYFLHIDYHSWWIPAQVRMLRYLIGDNVKCITINSVYVPNVPTSSSDPLRQEFKTSVS
jgi:hypothetical protein